LEFHVYLLQISSDTLVRYPLRPICPFDPLNRRYLFIYLWGLTSIWQENRVRKSYRYWQLSTLLTYSFHLKMHAPTFRAACPSSRLESATCCCCRG
jgi:hypothetical protein